MTLGAIAHIGSSHICHHSALVYLLSDVFGKVYLVLGKVYLVLGKVYLVLGKVYLVLGRSTWS